MNPSSAVWLQRLVAAAAWAYRSLTLTFLFLALLRLSFGDGGWFNEAVMAMLLSLPLVAKRLEQLRKAGGAA